MWHCVKMSQYRTVYLPLHVHINYIVIKLNVIAERAKKNRPRSKTRRKDSEDETLLGNRILMNDLFV